MLTRVLKRVYWRFVHPQLQRAGGLATPSDKVRILVRYGQGRDTLVETGTYLGDTTAGCLPHFRRIYTIELDPTLAENARERFKKQPTVTVVEGDSAAELENLLPSLNGGTVFWLDAHSCGEHTAKGELPLLAELRAILDRGQPDVILIDDAHHMGDQPTRFQQWIRDRFLHFEPTWPGTPTLEGIRELVKGRAEMVEASRDIIRIRLGPVRAPD